MFFQFSNFTERESTNIKVRTIHQEGNHRLAIHAGILMCGELAVKATPKEHIRNLPKTSNYRQHNEALTAFISSTIVKITEQNLV